MKKDILLEKQVEITKEGSLGLLAYGDLGLRAWRRVKMKSVDTKKDEQKK